MGFQSAFHGKMENKVLIKEKRESAVKQNQEANWAAGR